MSTAVAAALGLPELLQGILRHLSLQDLHVALRVSKDWKAKIDGSVLLQQALFLAPSRHQQISDDLPATFKNGRPVQLVDCVTGRDTSHVVLHPQIDAVESWIELKLQNGPLSKQFSTTYLNTLVAQPPPTTMVFMAKVSVSVWARHVWVTNRNGITFGDILGNMEILAQELCSPGETIRMRFDKYCTWDPVELIGSRMRWQWQSEDSQSGRLL